MPDLLTYLDNYNRPVTSTLTTADQLVFSRLPFLPLNGIVSSDPTETISLPNAMQQLSKKLATTAEHLLLPNDRLLIEKLSKTFRYQKVLLSGFQIHSLNDLERQCGGLTVQIEPHTKAVVFRGADGTKLGWQSDLKILYNPILSDWQTFSQSYLAQVAAIASDTLQIIGFSKGGSMAIYAASHADGTLKRQITQIINFDGPQIFEDHLSATQFKTHFQTFVPQLPFFTIGSKFATPVHVVNSTTSGIWQHDIYSWQLHDDQPVILGDVRLGDTFLSTTLPKWLQQQTQGDAHRFVNTFWEILNQTNAISVNDLLKHWQQVTKEFRLQSTSFAPLAKEMGQKALQSAFQIIIGFTHF